MHGDDLPDSLSAISIALTLVVIWFAWRTVREARKATEEEQKTVAELGNLLVVTAEIQSHARYTLEYARQTAELAGAAGKRDERRQDIEVLRAMQAIAGRIQHIVQDHMEATPGTWRDDTSWSCYQQTELAQLLTRITLELPATRALAHATGAAPVMAGCGRAYLEIQDVLTGLGASDS